MTPSGRTATFFARRLPRFLEVGCVQNKSTLVHVRLASKCTTGCLCAKRGERLSSFFAITSHLFWGEGGQDMLCDSGGKGNPHNRTACILLSQCSWPSAPDFLVGSRDLVHQEADGKISSAWRTDSRPNRTRPIVQQRTKIRAGTMPQGEAERWGT